jgi:hypothetical protein
MTIRVDHEALSASAGTAGELAGEVNSLVIYGGDAPAIAVGSAALGAAIGQFREASRAQLTTVADQLGGASDYLDGVAAQFERVDEILSTFRETFNLFSGT